MKTIKIIDLLNKIANMEELPKEIYFCGRIYELDDYNHYMYEKYGLYEDLLDFTLNVELDEFLNDEVKIIEEEKEIEKIPYHYNFGYIDCGDLKREVIEELSNNFNYFADKINEIIDEIKKFKENI